METYKVTIMATRGMDNITVSEKEIKVSSLEDIDIDIGQVRDFWPLDRETHLTIGFTKLTNE